ncbi:MAG: ABC-type Zn uptake system ZnuABC Zn-binding protein ZnuA, partial [Verrucomicrobiales bacterium]
MIHKFTFHLGCGLSALGLCLGLVLSSCGGGDGQAGDGRLFVVATTGMVGDMVQAIGGDE